MEVFRKTYRKSKMAKKGFRCAAFLIAPLLVSCSHMPRAPASGGGYAVIDRIAGPDGGYDYLSVDPVAQRLFVGREYGVMAVDLPTGKVIDKLVSTDDVAAVLQLSGTSLMLSTVYDGKTILIFDRSTGKISAELPAGENPDAAAYDDASGLAFVMNAGDGTITIVDIAALEVVDTITVGGKPEAAVSDGMGHLFVNIEDTAQVAVIDIASRKILTRYNLHGCFEPTGLAYDSKTGLLISSCHNGVAKLTDARSGADHGTVPIGKEADGAIFDKRTRLAYIPALDGFLTIFHITMKGQVDNVNTVITRKGARTAALDPNSGRAYLAAPEFLENDNGDEAAVPGNFVILVVAPM